MPKIIIMKGLPASGKSTIARKHIIGGNCKRINKDLLRDMFDFGEYSKENEEFVNKMKEIIMLRALINGNDVVVDDCNLNPIHEKRIRELVKTMSDFRSDAEKDDEPISVTVINVATDVEECVKRDKDRDNPVGEKVIRDMHKKYG